MSLPMRVSTVFVSPKWCDMPALCMIDSCLITRGAAWNDFGVSGAGRDPEIGRWCLREARVILPRSVLSL